MAPVTGKQTSTGAWPVLPYCTTIDSHRQADGPDPARLCIDCQRLDPSIQVCLELTNKRVAHHTNDLLRGNRFRLDFVAHCFLQESRVARRTPFRQSSLDFADKLCA